MEHRTTRLDKAAQGPYTFIDYHSTCQVNEGSCGGRSTWYCCQCGDGPQPIAISVACCMCGHHRCLYPPSLKKNESPQSNQASAEPMRTTRQLSSGMKNCQVEVPKHLNHGELPLQIASKGVSDIGNEELKFGNSEDMDFHYQINKNSSQNDEEDVYGRHLDGLSCNLFRGVLPFPESDMQTTNLNAGQTTTSVQRGHDDYSGAISIMSQRRLPSPRHNPKFEDKPGTHSLDDEIIASSIENQDGFSKISETEDSYNELFSDTETDYEYSSCTDTPSSVESQDWFELNLSPITRHVVDRLMSGLHFMFDLKSGIIMCTSGEAAPSSASTNNSTLDHSASAPKDSKKRSISDDNSQAPEDDDGNERNKRPRSNRADPGKKGDPRRKLACHYFKRNPEKHSQRSACTGPGWDKVHRVKEHLYRQHILRQCSRCYLNFKTDEELQEHQRQPQSCELRVENRMEGIDHIKLKQLQSRKGLAGTSERERWEAVYRILFPDDDFSQMPTPYYDYGPKPESDSRKAPSEPYKFEEYCRRELPHLVRRQLEIMAEKESRQIEERLKRQIVQTVRSCYEQLVLSFQQENHPAVIKPQGSLTSESSVNRETPAPAAVLSNLGVHETEPIFTPPPMTFNNFDHELEANNLHDVQNAPPQSEGYSRDLDVAYGSTSPLSLQISITPDYSHILQSASRKPESCQEIFADFSQTSDPVTKALITNFDQGGWSEPGHLHGPPGKAPILTEKQRGLRAFTIDGSIEDYAQSHHLAEAFQDIHPVAEDAGHAAEGQLANPRILDQYPGVNEVLEHELQCAGLWPLWEPE